MLPKVYILFASLIASTAALPTGTGAHPSPRITGESLSHVDDELEETVWKKPELPNPAIPAVWPPPSIPPVWPPPLPWDAGHKARDNAKQTLLPEVIDALTSIFKDKQVPGSSSNAKVIENEIEDNLECQPLTLIFARGTNGAGNMGEVIGPALANSLRSRLKGQVMVQGVKYPATLLASLLTLYVIFPLADRLRKQGNLKLGAEGGPEMARLLEQVLNRCPETRVALAGYSQGAMVAHYAAAMLRKSNPAVAIVTFGDPLDLIPFDNFDPRDVKRFCAQGDPICLNGLDFKAHSSYDRFAGEAAQFIIDAAGLEPVKYVDN